jgi:hypothetical protein
MLYEIPLCVQDGKDGIKFYTDANYFFELWRSEMLQSTEKAEKVRRGGLKGSRFVYFLLILD